MLKTSDQKLYEAVLDAQQQSEDAKPHMYASAFLVHVVLKLVPLGLFILDPLFKGVFTTEFSTQLILLFVVVEFWWTKNVTGRRMLGVTWFFADDVYGTQRLMFECRANEEMIYAANTKLFWIVQFGYIVTPFLFIIGLIIVIPYAGGIPTRKVILDSKTQILINVAIMASGIANIFYFFKVVDAAQERQVALRTRLGIDYVRKLGLGSITSFH